LGGNTADTAHKKALAHQPVGRGYDTVRAGVHYFGYDLQINKAGMVHKYKAGHFFGQSAFVFEPYLHQIGYRRDPHDTSEQNIRLYRLFVFWFFKGVHL